MRGPLEIEDAVERCRRLLKEWFGLLPEPMPANPRAVKFHAGVDPDELAHIVYYLDCAADSNRHEEAIRLLGFVQGFLWTVGAASLRDLGGES